MKHALLATALGLAALLAAPTSFARDQAARWTPAEAKAWYARQSWPLGSNYLPANAINELEMWQATPSIRRRSTRNSAGRSSWA